MSVVERLRAAMKDQGLVAEDIMGTLNVTPQTIRNWTSGRTAGPTGNDLKIVEKWLARVERAGDCSGE